MPERRSGEGVRGLLFERLAVRRPFEEPPSPEEPCFRRALDAEQLRESVRREMGRLLNTRAVVPAAERAGRVLTTMDYGVPDTADPSVCDVAAQRDLARQVEEAVTAFEPRLRQVRATVEVPAEGRRRLVVRVEAVLAAGGVVEPFTFTLGGTEP